MYLNVIKRALPYLFISVSCVLYFVKTKTDIDSFSLNFDESFTYYLTTLPFKEFFYKIYSDTQQPLYFIIQKLVSFVFTPENPNNIRYTSLFFGIVFIALFFIKSIKEYSKPTVFFGTIFLIFNPIFSEVSFLARPYTLLILLLYINFQSFLELKSRKNISLFLSTLVLGSLTHYLFIFYLASLTVYILINIKTYLPTIKEHSKKVVAVVLYFLCWPALLAYRFVQSPELTNWTNTNSLTNLYYSLTDMLYYTPSDYIDRFVYIAVMVFLIFFFRPINTKLKKSSTILLIFILLLTFSTYFVIPITTYRFISMLLPVFIVVVLEICKRWNFKYLLLVFSVYIIQYTHLSNFLPVNYKGYAKLSNIFLNPSDKVLCIFPKAPFNPIDFYTPDKELMCDKRVNFSEKVELETFNSIVLLESHNFSDGIETEFNPSVLFKDFDLVLDEKPFYILKRKVK